MGNYKLVILLQRLFEISKEINGQWGTVHPKYYSTELGLLHVSLYEGIYSKDNSMPYVFLHTDY